MKTFFANLFANFFIFIFNIRASHFYIALAIVFLILGVEYPKNYFTSMGEMFVLIGVFCFFIEPKNI